MRSIPEKAVANWLGSAHGSWTSSDTGRETAGLLDMTMRSRRETVHFRHPFRLKGIDRQLSAGAYEVVTDEEMIEGLSFPCFRRVATMIMVPGAAPRHASVEMVSISSIDLSDAQRNDASAPRE
jgi:hypothetical protein